MKRQVSLEEISDGRLYGRHDLAKTGCGGCRGCSQCCRGMGTSVILDPLDLHRLMSGTGQSFEALMADKLELNVVDGIILPNLKMTGEAEACGFLNAEGRCSVHAYRPGVCRLFPLGRYYADDDSGFHYILQVKECPAPNKTKVRIEKWIDTPNPEQYERFVLQWHSLLETASRAAAEAEDDQAAKNINLYVLKLFYLLPYDPQKDFYTQFDQRLLQALDILAG